MWCTCEIDYVLTRMSMYVTCIWVYVCGVCVCMRYLHTRVCMRYLHTRVCMWRTYACMHVVYIYVCENTSGGRCCVQRLLEAVVFHVLSGHFILPCVRMRSYVHVCGRCILLCDRMCMCMYVLYVTSVRRMRGRSHIHAPFPHFLVNPYIYIYIYIYIICIYVYIHMHVICIYIYIYILMHVCIFAFMHGRMSVAIHSEIPLNPRNVVCIYAYVLVCICKCICLYT
jgi:hypothetical protein